MNYVKMDSIIERFNRVKIQGSDFNEEELLEWTYEALQFINNKEALMDIEEIIYLKEGKVKLPIEIQTLLKVYDSDDNQLHEAHNGYELIKQDDYIINNGYLYTDRQGALKLIYSTVQLDENDRPLIPDNNYLISAIIAYLRFKVGERAFWAGKILQNQYQILQQDWLWNLPVAQNSGKMKIMQDPTKFAKMYTRHYTK